MMSRQSTSQKERLEFMRSMLVQLRAMADADNHEMLAYLIEMAQLEANEVALQGTPRHSGTLKRNSLA
ncbi:hypothetical protein [Mesorhizobium xinjiangense]|uniref:hypothetical protein n=1 Tax=Mesorhizobium xinjiangense TaxID=2678685 RepID=UPI0012EEC1D7|nr:hypothetical protein [Mesorhizobium xinjiangense]